MERYSRGQDGAWRHATVEDLGEAVELPSIGCRLALNEVYGRVEFPPVDLTRGEIVRKE